MNFVLSLILLMSVSNSSQRKMNQEGAASKEDQILIEYLSCQRELKTAEDVRVQKTCALGKIFSSAEVSRKERLAAWLVMGPELKKIRRCGPQDELRIQAFPEKTNYVSCFEFILDGDLKVGFAFFKVNSKKQLGLYSLHY